MARIVKMLCVTAALAVIMLLAQPSKARATFEVAISVDGGAFTNVGGSTSTVGNTTQLTITGFNSGSFAIGLVAAATNSPGQPSGATLQLTGFNVNATSAFSAGETIAILATSTDYTLPVSPPQALLTSALSDLNIQGDVTTTLTSYADLNNDTAFPSLPATNSAVSAYLAALGVQTAPLSVTLNNQAGAGTLADSTAFNATAPYALSELLVFKFEAGGSGGNTVITSGSGNATVTTPVPSTAVLILSALPLLGLGFWLCRRTTRKVPVAA